MEYFSTWIVEQKKPTKRSYETCFKIKIAQLFTLEELVAYWYSRPQYKSHKLRRSRAEIVVSNICENEKSKYVTKRPSQIEIGVPTADTIQNNDTNISSWELAFSVWLLSLFMPIIQWAGFRTSLFYLKVSICETQKEHRHKLVLVYPAQNQSYAPPLSLPLFHYLLSFQNRIAI